MSEVIASLDGKIREIKVRVGEVVGKNQEIFVIESPRLITLILATDPGIVEKLEVETGNSVKVGQILARVRSND